MTDTLVKVPGTSRYVLPVPPGVVVVGVDPGWGAGSTSGTGLCAVVGVEPVDYATIRRRDHERYVGLYQRVDAWIAGVAAAYPGHRLVVAVEEVAGPKGRRHNGARKDSAPDRLADLIASNPRQAAGLDAGQRAAMVDEVSNRRLEDTAAYTNPDGLVRSAVLMGMILARYGALSVQQWRHGRRHIPKGWKPVRGVPKPDKAPFYPAVLYGRLSKEQAAVCRGDRDGDRDDQASAYDVALAAGGCDPTGFAGAVWLGDIPYRNGGALKATLAATRQAA